MRPEDVPAAERVSDEGFFELDTRLQRAARPGAPAALRRPHRAVWIERTRHLAAHRPRRLLGGRGRDRDGRASPRRSAARRCGAWRRTPCCRAARARASASRCWPRPSTTAAACTRGMLSASSDAKAVRIYRQAGFDAAPPDVPDRDRRPVRDPGGGEGARGQRRRRRPDGLPRPGGARCRRTGRTTS